MNFHSGSDRGLLLAYATYPPFSVIINIFLPPLPPLSENCLHSLIVKNAVGKFENILCIIFNS